MYNYCYDLRGPRFSKDAGSFSLSMDRVLKIFIELLLGDLCVRLSDLRVEGRLNSRQGWINAGAEFAENHAIVIS